MNHQPFEVWLLEDRQLSIEQKRELDTHLRSCLHCTALAETGMALRTPRMASPAAGFTARFQKRLEAQRVAERRRRLWGVILFILAGLGVFAATVKLVRRSWDGINAELQTRGAS